MGHRLIQFVIFFVGGFDDFTLHWLFLLTRASFLWRRGFDAVFTVVQDLVPEFTHDWEVGGEPLSVSLDVHDDELFPFGPVEICRFVLNEITGVEVQNFHTKLQLGHVMFGDLRFYFTRHGTFDFHQLPRLRDTIGRPPEPEMFGMWTQTNFVNNLTVSLFIEDARFIFILFAVSCRFITCKLFTDATLFQ